MSDSIDTSIVGEGPTAHLDHQIRRLEADLRAAKAAHSATTERLGEANRLLDSERTATRNALERVVEVETQRDLATEREHAALAERDAARDELEYVTEQCDRARRYAARLLLESGPHSLTMVRLKADLAAAQAEATEWRARANAPFVLRDTPLDAAAAGPGLTGAVIKLTTVLGPDVAGAAVAVWPPAPNTEVTGGNFDVMPPGSAAELDRLRKRVAMDAEFLRTFRAEQRDIIAAQQAEVSRLAAEHAGVLARAQAAVCKGIEEIREAASMHAPTVTQRAIVNAAIDELEQSRRYHHAIDELLREFIAGVDPNGRQLALIREKLIELAALHQTLAESERALAESQAREAKLREAVAAELKEYRPCGTPYCGSGSSEAPMRCQKCRDWDSRRALLATPADSSALREMLVLAAGLGMGAGKEEPPALRRAGADPRPLIKAIVDRVLGGAQK